MLQTSKLFVYFLQVYFYKWHITKNTVHVEQSLQEDMTASYNTSQILNFVSFFTPSKKIARQTTTFAVHFSVRENVRNNSKTSKVMFLYFEICKSVIKKTKNVRTPVETMHGVSSACSEQFYILWLFILDLNRW